MLLPLCWLCAGALLVAAQDTTPPPSPCPDVFWYAYDMDIGRWSGRLVVPVPPQAKRMVVVASLFVVDVALPTEHPGGLSLLYDTPTVVKQVRTHKTKAVDYVLELPAQSPLPLVDKIKVNRKVICQGSPVKSKVRTKVTFTHRLNGLLPPADRPGRLPGLMRGHSLDMVDEGRQTPNNGLELLDNEVFVAETQETELMAGRNQNPVIVDLENVDKFEEKLHPDDDAEMMDNEIPREEDKPRPKNRYPIGGNNREDIPNEEVDLDDVELLDNEIHGEEEDKPKPKDRYPIGGKDREDIPNDEVDLDDVELLDSEIPDEEDKPKPKDRYPIGGKDREDIPNDEVDLDDVELLDSEIPDEEDEPKDKDQDTNRKELPETEFDSADHDLDLMDNEIPEAHGKPRDKDRGTNRKERPLTEFDSADHDFDLMDNEIPQNIPSSGFDRGFHKTINEADLDANKNNYDGLELLDDESSELNYDDNDLAARGQHGSMNDIDF